MKKTKVKLPQTIQITYIQGSKGTILLTSKV